MTISAKSPNLLVVNGLERAATRLEVQHVLQGRRPGARKIDNQTKFTGKVSQVSDTSFVMTDQQTGKPVKLAYEDVRQVNQKGMSKGSKVAIGIAVGAAASIGVGLLVCYSQGQCRH
jgi:hypothetical protein